MTFTSRLLIFSAVLFIFTACSSNLISPTLKKPTTHKSETFTLPYFVTPNIEGTYNLIEGSYKYNNDGLSFKHKVQASTIIIEKLTDNEFGFYYITKLDGLTTNSYFGGFLFKKGKFYKKVIDDSTLKVSLLDNIRLTKFKDILRLTIKTANSKRDILWKKSDDIDHSLSNELEEERKAYLSFYREKI